MPGQVGPSAAPAATITNSAGNNVVTKSNGTNLVASNLSDDGTTVAVASGKILQVAAGTGAVPSLIFAGGTNTGLSSQFADNVDFSIGGSAVARFTAAGNWRFGSKSLGFSSDASLSGTDIGMRSPSAGLLTITDGTDASTALRDLKLRDLIGTTTNNNAAAGSVGELLTAALASGSATSLSTGTAKTIISLSLTAGDWDVTGVLDYIPAATTTTAFIEQGASATDNTLGAEGTFSSCSGGNLSGTVLGSLIAEMIPTQRFSLAGTTTIYLVGKASFAVSTMTAYGNIRARRVR